MALTDKLIAIGDAIRAKTGTSGQFLLAQMPEAILSITGVNDEVVEYSQLNTQAAAYLDAADASYTDSNSATTTVMSNYADVSQNYSYPIGYTLTIAEKGTIYLIDESDPKKSWKWNVVIGECPIYNLIPEHIYRYTIVNESNKTIANGKLKSTGDIRMIRLSGTDNVRDMGGWDCAAGKVNYGLLYRGMNPGRSQTNINIMRNVLNIGAEIDFRQDSEASNITDSFLKDEVTYARYPLDHNSYQTNVRLDNENKWYENVRDGIIDIMKNVCFGVPVYYHCSIGCDRTGIVSFLIGAILGVSRDDLDKNYELSALSGTVGGRDVTNRVRTRSDWNNMANYFSQFNRPTLEENVIVWCGKVGVPIDLLNRFRKIMCSGEPDEIAYTSWITAKLTNVSSSNSVSELSLGSSFTTTLTVTIGDETPTVTVTMDGVNITSEVYDQSTGIISIPNVTGDVSIIATAALPYTNQIPISQSATGTDVFNGTGYMNGKYLSSASNGESSDSAFFATGFIPAEMNTQNGKFTFYVKGADWTSDSHCRFGIYKADKTLQNTFAGNSTTHFVANGTYYKLTVLDAANKYWKVETPMKNNSTPNSVDMYGATSYVRFSLKGSGDDVIVTVNEEIVY